MTRRSRPAKSIDEEKTREDLLREIAELRQRLAACETCARESLRDDMDRRQMGEDLRASEELLRLALIGGRMGAWKWQIDTGKVVWSEEQFRLWGHRPGDFEVNYQEWRSRVHPEDIDRVEQEVFRALAGAGDFLCEYRVVWPDGTAHWVEDRARILRNESGQALALHGVMLDISARKAMQRELIRAKELAEEASRAKSEFLATMSHEIRTPLTVVMAAIEHLLHLSTEHEAKSILEMADASAQRLHNLIEDILDFSRIEAGRLELHREPFDLRACLGRSLEIFRLQAQEKGLQLQCEVDPEVPIVVHGDPDRLAQVFVNLIGNAVKFTPLGAVTVRVENRPDSLLVSVHDTGIGIAEDKRNRLFQSFSQVDGSLTRKYGGTGLGLAISKALVELMGGSIWVESVEGKGSVFSFTLPGGARQHSASPAEESASPSPPPSFRPARILLVEDDPQVRKLLGLHLRQRQWEVVTADGGAQAMREWLAGGFDLILMDLQMPDMDGLEVARSIREREAESGSRTPIVALTAHACLERKEKSLAAGMDDFLCKPVSMEKLYAVVEKHLGRIPAQS